MCLLYANSDFDFGPILANVNSYILVCLIGKETFSHHWLVSFLDEEISQRFVGKTYTAIICLSCIFTALDQMNMLNFKEQFRVFLFEQQPEQLPISMNDINDCNEILKRKL